ncbi:MAG: substrate-binding domain-containing protein [Synechococcales cyanobacterium T60_A2020_003]|nr:substrate-binding domain-containing protein [Synechococcales cyanobacterium T60_A2020_003]
MRKLLTWGTGAIATLGMVGAIPLHAYGEDAIYDDVIYIDGAGATSLAPLFEAYMDAYAVYSDVPVSYMGIGSRDGIRNLLSGTVDFIGSDLPLTDGEVAQTAMVQFRFPLR